MGSLMAGWQTKPADAKEALKRSTSSVTKEEVERFWRAKKVVMENHLREAQEDATQARSILVPASPASDSGFETASSPSGSISWSPPITPTNFRGSSQEPWSARSPGWWQQSYWAFLNEPPVLEDRQNRYVAQLDLRAPLKLESDGVTNPRVYVSHIVAVNVTNPTDESAT